MSRLTSMDADEFIKKLLGGERDFKNIILPEKSQLIFPEHSQELVKLNKLEDLTDNPVDISDSVLNHLQIKNLWLSYLQAERTKFENTQIYNCTLRNSNFDNANFKKATILKTNFVDSSFQRADFEGANLYGINMLRANLREANLENAKLEGADLNGTILTGANVRNADFLGATLEKADLRNIRNLDQASSLEFTSIYETIVTKKEKRIFMEGYGNLFIVK